MGDEMMPTWIRSISWTRRRRVERRVKVGDTLEGFFLLVVVAAVVSV